MPRDLEIRDELGGALLENNPDAVVIIDSDQNIIGFNPAAEHIFGYARAEVLGQALELLLPQRFHATHRALVREFLNNGGFRPMNERTEISGLRKDGTTFPAEGTICRLQSATGAILVAFIRDISARKRDEARRLETENRFRAIFDRAFEFIGLLQPDGTLLEANQAALQFAGVSLDDVSGRPFWDTPWWAGDELRQARLRDAVARAAAGEFVRYAVGNNGRDGRRIVDFSLRPVRDGNGEVRQLIAEGRDITELQIANEWAQRLASRLQNAQRIGRMGAWSLDARTNDLWWSDEVYRLFGVDKTTFGASYAAFLRLVHPDDRKIVQNAVSTALKDREPYAITHRVVRPDGEIRFVREEAEIVLAGDGTPLVMDGIVQDITEEQERKAELRGAKERAEQAAQAKSRFLAMMSHELRTPLNAVIGFAEIIATETFGSIQNRKYLEYAGDIEASGKHLRDVINDVLDMSRVEAGQTELNEETVAVDDIVATVTRLLAQKASQHGVNMTFETKPPNLRLRADRRLLRQIVFNLIDNAIKYSDYGNMVWVHCDQTPERHLRLCVADHGRGIPEHQISSVTEAFTQVDNGPLRSADGVGLGLSLVKSFTELHGGHVSIDSELGKGTTVCVIFPPERTA